MKPTSRAAALLAAWIAGLVLVALPAGATHDDFGCSNHGGDTDGDGRCNDSDSDDDNDGAPDIKDRAPTQYSEMDFALYFVKELLT